MAINPTTKKIVGAQKISNNAQKIQSPTWAMKNFQSPNWVIEKFWSPNFGH
jgi:hypothetical protein